MQKEGSGWGLIVEYVPWMLKSTKRPLSEDLRWGRILVLVCKRLLLIKLRLIDQLSPGVSSNLMGDLRQEAVVANCKFTFKKAWRLDARVFNTAKSLVKLLGLVVEALTSNALSIRKWVNLDIKVMCWSCKIRALGMRINLELDTNSAPILAEVRIILYGTKLIG